MSGDTLLSPDLTADITQAAGRLLTRARAAGLRIVTAESCTGGLIAGTLTHHAGSSDVVSGGFVTYSNAMKQHLLGVRTITLEHHGAVSSETVAEMAAGALRAAPDAQIAIAVSGVAGPGGGTDAKPVGLVWFGLATPSGVHTEHRIFPGDRTRVRSDTVRHALELLDQAIA
ncbi:CinA family protein [Acetobacter sp. AN02]|uniref:CinA family protein n=1 Tax=Acetobacter sp. AN02 TaxID=2894186 RepID=UPI00243448A4|nr:CinA family protein [Acetobacter sp. AN02]MDG6095317.1 CinA family protein [Acetobacter sp. AN02]